MRFFFSSLLLSSRSSVSVTLIKKKRGLCCCCCQELRNWELETLTDLWQIVQRFSSRSGPSSCPCPTSAACPIKPCTCNCIFVLYLQSLQLAEIWTHPIQSIGHCDGDLLLSLLLKVWKDELTQPVGVAAIICQALEQWTSLSGL